MAFQTPITIKDALERIHAREYALPAIQREFVWSQEQICALFDSLMRGYPIGAFLFWEVKKKSLRKHNWYEFITRYHQKDDPHCHELTIADHSKGITAVLDGQQRLTALNIGIFGNYAEKLPRLRWNNPYAFPKRHLYLSLTQKVKDDESGSEFLFKMMPKKGTRMVLESQTAGDPSWFRVKDILKFKEIMEALLYLQPLGLADHPLAPKHLGRLYQMINVDPVISFYQEKSQNVDKVLDIFIRTNSGGTQLSHSDLLMSVAVAAWKGNAREKIHGFIDDLNKIGRQFQFNKDMILKAGLLISDISDIRFKVANFNLDNMETIEQKWDLITESLTTAVGLIASFGFSGMNFSNRNAVMIIAYYLSCRPDRSRVLDVSSEDRSAIRRWLMTVLVKRGLWVATDSLLLRARNAIKEHCVAGFDGDAVASAMAHTTGGMAFTDEEIEDLAETSYGDWSAYSLLSLMFDHIDTANNVFHIDHVVPRAQVTPARMVRAGLDDDNQKYISARINRLPNLQLLSGHENPSKSAKFPRQWMQSSRTFYYDRDRDSYAREQELGDWRVLPEDLEGFRDFYDARRRRIVERLKQLLPTRREDNPGAQE